jgi:hypothetical protein
MVKNLESEEMYNFIVNDFIDVWDSVANNNNENIARGNFLFGTQAMILLEFLCRLCSTDQTGKAIKEFSIELNKIQCKYFLELPQKSITYKDFTLPYIEECNNDSLLSILFDLIRNGLTHQYQQIIANLKDGKHFYIKLTGPKFGYSFINSRSQPNIHLDHVMDSNGDLELTVFPNILFIDLKDAVGNSGILEKNLQFNYLSRGQKRDNKKKNQQNTRKYYDLSIKDLVQVLEEKY